MSQPREASEADMLGLEAEAARRAARRRSFWARAVSGIDENASDMSAVLLFACVIVISIILMTIAFHSWPLLAGILGVPEDWQWVFGSAGFVVIIVICVLSYRFHHRLNNESDRDDHPGILLAVFMLANGIASSTLMVSVGQNQNKSWSTIKGQIERIEKDTERHSAWLEINLASSVPVETTKHEALLLDLQMRENELRDGWGISDCGVSFTGANAQIKRDLCNEFGSFQKVVKTQESKIAVATERAERYAKIVENDARIEELNLSRPQTTSIFDLFDGVDLGTETQRQVFFGVLTVLLVLIMEMLLALVCYLSARRNA